MKKGNRQKTGGFKKRSLPQSKLASAEGYTFFELNGKYHFKSRYFYRTYSGLDFWDFHKKMSDKYFAKVFEL